MSNTVTTQANQKQLSVTIKSIRPTETGKSMELVLISREQREFKFVTSKNNALKKLHSGMSLLLTLEVGREDERGKEQIVALHQGKERVF